MLSRSGAASGPDRHASSRLDRYLGDRIAQARVRQGMLLADLARTLGIGEALMAEHEHGLEKINAVLLHRIAEVLGVTLSSLFGFA